MEMKKEGKGPTDGLVLDVSGGISILHGHGCAGSVVLRLLAVMAVMLAAGMCRSPAYAHSETEPYAAMMHIAGVSDPEDLDESFVEEMYSFMASPVCINTATRSRLLDSGLFSQYQVASLLDYRSRSGDILSLAELAAVDGFGREYAAALSHFISFDSDALPGRSSDASGYVSNSLTLRYGARKKEREEYEHSYAFKYGLEINDRVEVNLTGRTGYGNPLFPPEVSSFNVTCYGRGKLGKVIAGDFNARFGQGLALWSGFSMGGLSAPESYSRRPSGLSPYRSYSGEGTFRGLAADFSAGRFTISSFLAAEGTREQIYGDRDAPLSLVPAVNIGYFGRDGQASVTCYAQSGTMLPGMGKDSLLMSAAMFSDIKCSADMRYVIRGTELFSEVAVDVINLAVAVVAGSRFRIGERLDMAVSGRYYPAGYSASRSGAVRSGTRCSNEYAVSVSGVFTAGEYVQLAGKTGFGSSVPGHRGVFGADVSHAPEPRYGTDRPTSQIKLLFDYDWQASPETGIAIRVTERLRNWGEPFRTDVRADVKYSSGKFALAVRMNALHCEGLGLLAYMEGGYRSGPLSLWLRAGAFRVDNWNDRIYAYERDAPGNFNVPAYYGRGYWTALTAGVKYAGWCRIYLRAAFQDCPWASPGADEGRPGKAEVKLQLSIDI